MSYTLLKQQKYRPREPKLYQTELPSDSVLAIDIETTGLDPLTCDIVLIGYAGDSGCGCIDVTKLDGQQLIKLREDMATKHVIYYNAAFDHAFLTYYGFNPTLAGDAMIMFKLLANEGFEGQGWSLSEAIDSVLGWPDNSKDTNSELLKKHKLTKANMYKLNELEPDDFNKYCALDAEAAWQLILYTYELCDNRGFQAVIDTHENEYMHLIELVIEGQLRGMEVDGDGLQNLSDEINKECDELIGKIRGLPAVADFLYEFESEDHIETTTEDIQKKIKAKKSDEPWSQLEWERIETPEKAPKWEHEYGTWIRYETVTKVKTKKLAGRKFNVNSKDHLRQLFFEHLGFSPKAFTDKGLAKISKNELPELGTVGKILIEYNKGTKLHGYVKKAILKSEPDGLLHISVRPHGTLTGRSAGTGGLNIQQLSKDERYLKNLIAREGYTLIDTDFTSLENVVLAEFSRDAGLMELYGSGKTHDAYLWVAAHMFPDSGIAEVYNLENPTEESVDAAKKQFKKLRTIGKVIVLASNYGAGANTIHAGIVRAGVEIELEAVKVLHKKFWTIFEGIKGFEYTLLQERLKRGNYVLNGVNRPMIIIDDYINSLGKKVSIKKDIVNRFCLGEDTLILTNTKGFVRIADIELTDKVWNGEAWCSHNGVVIKGVKDTISIDGISATVDHKFLDINGDWHEFKEYKVQEGTGTTQQARELKRYSFSWADIWELGSSLLRAKASRWYSILSMYLST